MAADTRSKPDCEPRESTDTTTKAQTKTGTEVLVTLQVHALRHDSIINCYRYTETRLRKSGVKKKTRACIIGQICPIRQ